MKLSLILPFLLIATSIALTSCTPMYQVIETSSEDVKIENNTYVFENSDLTVKYNLWADGGAMFFYITNKLDTPLYIDWDKSHFIYNGFSYEYWYDSEEASSFYSSSSSSSSSTFSDASMYNLYGSTYGIKSSTSSSGKNVAVASTSKFKPKKIIELPPKSTIVVYKFSINKTPFYNCDFNLKHVGSKTPKTKSYTKDDSPLVFRNYITYSGKETFEQRKIIDNTFYVSSVSFMAENIFLGNKEYINNCEMSGTKYSTSHYKRPYKKPNSYYLPIIQ